MPLSISTLDIMREWLLDVPLEIQILLEAFLNRRSIAGSSDSTYLKSQIERLYSTYDILLNTKNSKYIGTLQEANTQNLLLHSNSIGSVFAVTSRSGITSSLKTAENQLRSKSMDDYCYYDTFLKPYVVKCNTPFGNNDIEVPLRKCSVILMLDNLVRLKTKEDPDPGESRSKQICTIPITIQGLPKESYEVSRWQDNKICDRTSTCPCKVPKYLSKSSFKETFLDLNAEQSDVHNFFSFMCILAPKVMWAAVPVEDQQKLWLDAVKSVESLPPQNTEDTNSLCNSSSIEQMEEAAGDMLEIDPVTSQDISDLHEVLKEFEISCTTEESDDDFNMSLLEQSIELMNIDEPSKDDSSIISTKSDSEKSDSQQERLPLLFGLKSILHQPSYADDHQLQLAKTMTS